MAPMQATHAGSGAVLAARVLRADTPWTRARGLLGRPEMPREEGLWIVPCSMIHTFFMRFSIDAVFLDPELRVVRVLEGLEPWRISPWVRHAGSVLELAGGSLRGSVKPGEVLDIR